AAMRKWSAAAADLLGRVGPATPLRAMFELLVRPLVESLGFVEVGAPEPSGPALLVNLAANGRAALLLVAPWRERLDGHWRGGAGRAGACSLTAKASGLPPRTACTRGASLRST